VSLRAILGLVVAVVAGAGWLVAWAFKAQRDQARAERDAALKALHEMALQAVDVAHQHELERAESDRQRDERRKDEDASPPDPGSVLPELARRLSVSAGAAAGPAAVPAPPSAKPR
jgi:hypothetical protein